jgi:adenine deaminase
MKKLMILLAVCFANTVTAQENVYPVTENKGLVFIKNGTVHVGNGQVIENCTIKINGSKIVEVGPNVAIPSGDVKVIEAKGKHVYPGLILSASQFTQRSGP